MPSRTVRGVAVSTALLALLPAASAAAASKPGVSTTAATKVSANGAQLNGFVNPRSQATTYSFQYGTTTKYGATTPVASAGAGTRAVRAATLVGGLTPAKTYHFRVVASNPTGVSSSGDRTFRTSKVPLSLSVAATPNPVPYASATTLTGQLAGTDGGGQTLQVQYNPFPFTAGFMNTGNPLVTNPDGTFVFPVPGLLANAQFQVTTTTGSKATSTPILVGVSPKLSADVSTTRPRKGALVRFAGTVTPRFFPAEIAIEKRNSKGAFVVIAGTVTKPDGTAKAKYARRVRVPRGGTYRVFVGLADSRFAGTTSREVTLHVR